MPKTQSRPRRNSPKSIRAGTIVAICFNIVTFQKTSTVRKLADLAHAAGAGASSGLKVPGIAAFGNAVVRQKLRELRSLFGGLVPHLEGDPFAPEYEVQPAWPDPEVSGEDGYIEFTYFFGPDVSVALVKKVAQVFQDSIAQSEVVVKTVAARAATVDLPPAVNAVQAKALVDAMSK